MTGKWEEFTTVWKRIYHALKDYKKKRKSNVKSYPITDILKPILIHQWCNIIWKERGNL